MNNIDFLVERTLDGFDFHKAHNICEMFNTTVGGLSIPGIIDDPKIIPSERDLELMARDLLKSSLQKKRYKRLYCFQLWFIYCNIPKRRI